jgi:molybdopterin synthase catalytic subunit
MLVRVRLFAVLRERAGRDSIELDLPEGARVADALAAVDELAGGLSLVLAVNREYAPPDAPLAAGDELALIPPVSGGAGGPPSPHARLTSEPLSLDAVAARVRDPRAGAVVTFQGVTREVHHLDYEAYEEMALEAMRAILRAAVARHGLCAAAAEHRVGTVPLSEPSVVVAVSAPHRAEAFAGAREVIDELKARAPVWKREVEASGEARWVIGSQPTRPEN